MVCGVAAAFGLTRLLSSLLFGVQAVGSAGVSCSPVSIGRRCARCSMVAGNARESGRSHPRTAVRIGPCKQEILFKNSAVTYRSRPWVHPPEKSGPSGRGLPLAGADERLGNVHGIGTRLELIARPERWMPFPLAAIRSGFEVARL